MKFVSSLRNLLAGYLLKYRLQQNPRQKEFHNLQSARTAGVLFNASEEKTVAAIKLFLEKLTNQGLMVKALGWVNARKIPDSYKETEQISYYCKRDINWAGEPRTPKVLDFVDRKFDLFFDLTGSANTNIRYIASMLQASCKIGLYGKELSHLDLMIDLKQEASLENLIEESISYLSQIKKNSNDKK